VFAELLGEALFQVDQMLEAVAADGQSVLGVGDHLRPAIVRVGAHLQQIERDHVADHLTHRLPGDPCPHRHVRGPGTLGVQEAEDRVVRHLHLGMTVEMGPADHVGLQRPIGPLDQCDQRLLLRSRHLSS
jgi:hypothetical protein